MNVDELLDDIRQDVEFPITKSELVDRFGDTEFQLDESGDSPDVPVDESRVTTLAAELESKEEDLEGEPDTHTYESAEEIRDSVVPPQMW